MKTLIHESIEKTALKKSQVFFFLHALFFIGPFIIEQFSTGLSISKTGGLILFYVLFYQVKEALNYSYWTFCFVGIFLVLLKILNVYSLGIFWVVPYIVSLFFYLLEASILNRPIFYPLISWWVYDFRSKKEIRIDAGIGELKTKGRLSDVRKKSCRVALFEEVKLGQSVIITVEESEKEQGLTLSGKLVSRRHHSLGRPFNYGVIFEDNKNIQKYKFLSRVWKKRK